MQNINDMPTINRLKKIFNDISSGKERLIYLEYSHTFSQPISQNVLMLKKQKHVISFVDLNKSMNENRRFISHWLIDWIKRTLQFLIDLNPFVAIVNLLANMALDVANYHIRKSDIKNIRKNLILHHKPHKHQKIKKIIIVEELADLTEEECKYVDFLAYLIYQGYISSAALVIISDKLHNIKHGFNNIKIYKCYFTLEDYKAYTGKNIVNNYLLEIVDSLELKYLDILNNLLDGKEENEVNSAKEIINILIKSKGYDLASSDLTYFLKICSTLFEEFKLFDLEALSNDIDINYTGMLPVSIETNLLKEKESYTYSFTEIKFKEYFQKTSPLNLSKEDGIKIIKYLEDRYPFLYVDLAITSKFIPISDDEKLSFFLIAYYHNKKQKLKFKNIIQEFLENTFIGKLTLNLEKYRAYIKDYTIEQLKFEAYKAFEWLNRNNTLRLEAKLCILSYIADILYETETNERNLMKIFDYYKDIFSKMKVFSISNEKYLDFILDAIIFSTSISNYSVQKQVNRLIHLVENCFCNDLNKMIRFYSLGNLLHALDNNKAVNFTRIAFDISKDNIILHNESMVNYSVSLIGLSKYSEAFKILTSCNEQVISADYRLALENNKLISGYLSGKKTIKTMRSRYQHITSELTSPPTSDQCIILNNYCSAMIIDSHLQYKDLIEAISFEVINYSDSYHTFFAINNLLVLYYLINDKNKFDVYKTQLHAPYIHRNYKVISTEKVNYLEKNFEKRYSLFQLDIFFKELFVSEGYGNNLYISAVVWGLMERWFK